MRGKAGPASRLLEDEATAQKFVDGFEYGVVGKYMTMKKWFLKYINVDL